MRKALLELDARHGTHPGLILQRYLVRRSDPSKDLLAKDRRALFDSTRQAACSESLNSVYAEAYARWVSSFAADLPQRSEQLASVGRLAVGLGSENVLETGLRLHQTYGVPIIPGSALKGLASHYCHDVWGQRHDAAAAEENRLFQRDGNYHSLLFGKTDDAGAIAFHDAWIVPASLGGALRLDVMTPHHPKWQTNEAPPTDFDSPVPVTFLSVAGTFDIRLSWAGPVAAPRDQAEAWTELAMQLLREALAEWGVGGKTSSGYGRLVPPDVVPSGRESSAAVPQKPVVLPKPGQRVDARLLEERTKKGGWRAVHVSSKLSGPIQNSADVPGDKSAGDMLELIVASATERELGFRYPTAADEARAQRAPAKKQGDPRKGGGRR